MISIEQQRPLLCNNQWEIYSNMDHSRVDLHIAIVSFDTDWLTNKHSDFEKRQDS